MEAHALPLALLFFFLCAFVTTASAEDKVDFSQYDAPLYDQVVGHIAEKVSARLGPGHNRRDRYFIIPFAYENRGNDPEFSHSFITVIRVLAEGSKPHPASQLKTGKFKRWQFEAYTISWIPNDFLENPNLCVFNGVGARLFAGLNKCPVSEGKCFDLKDTLTMASNAKVAVGMWGPYEVVEKAFDLGVNRKKLLDRGEIKYRADDRLYRKNRVAINCFHAMAGLDELYPNGGLFGTGFNMWGLNGTARVLIEYTEKPSNQGMILEPVDVKNDRFGFVYAASPEDRRIYNPFKGTAFAYQR
jgi:hypothetical protein